MEAVVAASMAVAAADALSAAVVSAEVPSEVVSAEVPSGADIAVAATEALIAVVVDIAAAMADMVVATVTDAAMDMVAGVSGSDLAIHTTAAITAIPMLTDIHTTAAMQTPMITIPMHMLRIPTAIRLRSSRILLNSSNINMARLRSNSSSPMVRRLPISGKAIRHRSSRTAIHRSSNSRTVILRLRRRTGRNRTPRLPRRQTIRLRLRPATTSPMASGITLVKPLLS